MSSETFDRSMIESVWRAIRKRIADVNRSEFTNSISRIDEFVFIELLMDIPKNGYHSSGNETPVD